MKWIFIPLSLFSLLSHAQVAGPQDRDFNLAVTASGTLTSGERFESIGVATFTGLENSLSSRGGFTNAYRDFKSQNQLTYGVWQEAEAFSAYLKDCNIDVPSDLIAMRIGIDRIFASSNDSEVNQVLTDLGPKLSFERKIELASRVGGVLLQGYDNARAGGGSNGGGIISFRDMISARQNRLPAGVCRDMAQAIAMSLKQMGVNESYVVAYQTARGGHATVLAQDPNNPGKTYNINYGFVTSTESGSALSHLQQDSTNPSVGTDMRIFSAEGKPLTTLPTHLGVALHEIAGGKASDLDPLLRSENQVVGARYRVNDSITVGAGGALTPDGDKVVAITTNIQSDSEHTPFRASVVVYNNQRETNLRGDLNSMGIYMEGEQRLISDPLTVRTSAGNVAMNVEGRVNFRNNISMNSQSGSANTAKTMSMGNDISASVGGRTTFNSNNGRTGAVAFVEATGALAKSDVRDEGSTTFDLRQIAGSVQVSQKIGENLAGHAGATVVMRPGLGAQANQELGLMRTNSNGSITGLVLTHEGAVSGQTPVFVPGTRENYRIDVRHLDERYAAEAGVFCRRLNNDRRDCGVRTSATIKFGPGKRN